MKLVNKDGREYTAEDLLNSGYVKVGSKTCCEYWKKGDVIEVFNTIETFNTSEVEMYTEAMNENQDKTNKNRLKKIHRLKRENRTLSDRRKGLTISKQNYSKAYYQYYSTKEINLLFSLSEQIGKNSAKIQRLRILISQSKN